MKLHTGSKYEWAIREPNSVPTYNKLRAQFTFLTANVLVYLSKFLFIVYYPGGDQPIARNSVKLPLTKWDFTVPEMLEMNSANKRPMIAVAVLGPIIMIILVINLLINAFSFCSTGLMTMLVLKPCWLVIDVTVEIVTFIFSLMFGIMSGYYGVTTPIEIDKPTAVQYTSLRVIVDQNPQITIGYWILCPNWVGSSVIFIGATCLTIATIIMIKIAQGWCACCKAFGDLRGVRIHLKGPTRDTPVDLSGAPIAAGAGGPPPALMKGKKGKKGAGVSSGYGPPPGMQPPGAPMPPPPPPGADGDGDVFTGRVDAPPPPSNVSGVPSNTSATSASSRSSQRKEKKEGKDKHKDKDKDRIKIKSDKGKYSRTSLREKSSHDKPKKSRKPRTESRSSSESPEKPPKRRHSAPEKPKSRRKSHREEKDRPKSHPKSRQVSSASSESSPPSRRKLHKKSRKR